MIDPKELQFAEGFNLAEVRRKVIGRGRSKSNPVYSKTGRYVRSRIPNEIKGTLDIAWDATLREAALRKSARIRSDSSENEGYCVSGRPLILRRDIREKVRLKWGNRLILFLVDASDSMDVSNQLAAAKGAVLSLLSAAYIRRDRVGMIVFRDQHARVLLPPTTSIYLAQEKLAVITPGGATPLADGLLTAWQTIRSERLKYPGRSIVLIILSDGETNVPLVPGGDTRKELKIIAGLIKKERIHGVFVDTAPMEKNSLEPRWIAGVLAAEYKHLQRVQSADLVGFALKQNGDSMDA